MALLRPVDGNKPWIIVVGVWGHGNCIAAGVGLKVPLVGRGNFASHLGVKDAGRALRGLGLRAQHCIRGCERDLGIC